MNRILSQFFSSPYVLILITVLIKIPMFFTKNIQEDSFITWRVAGNLLDYGVIGFNGEEKISASTTHLYVFITAFFRLIFEGYFIYPLLTFSAILFGIGSWWLSKILFPIDFYKRGFFVLLLNMVPPALTASVLGMEYGILFFLYNGLLYFGLFRQKKWAFLIFPILLIWTRIDAVIFLGVIFWADFILKKKLNYIYILGGIMGLMTVVGFNYLYFGEWVNHTITAKKIAYKNLIQNDSLEYFLYQWAYYGGLIKKYSLFTFVLFLIFLAFLLFAAKRIWQEKTLISRKSKIILLAVFVFALLKITVFAYFKAYFDWYYWLPRVFLFAVVLYFVLNFIPWKRKILYPLIFLSISGTYVFQWIQSYTIGYMEERQRMQIAADINTDQVGLKQSILLEPAGIIPFYTNLYTYDEVGLVNKRINQEMLKDEKFWWINSLKKYQPDYILTIAEKPGLKARFYITSAEEERIFNSDYTLMKSYPISKIHNQAPLLLKWIYELRPIGKDYFLYKISKPST
ncbi:hypothetical protein [Chryseobacterium sp. MP_3.2]|uniref:hypothetical protein n=1 Tax=Chryseobacterium sp. MP_3.2 TaxID=3071712 RepID=UPI002DFBCE7C|nr:hypothetical protein [Chryseobacterium sp. MP_3.2]